MLFTDLIAKMLPLYKQFENKFVLPSNCLHKNTKCCNLPMSSASAVCYSDHSKYVSALQKVGFACGYSVLKGDKQNEKQETGVVVNAGSGDGARHVADTGAAGACSE